MTTLYRPVLIESAEQAEALGWKTPVQIVLDRTREVHDVRLFEDFAEDFWPDALEPGNRWVYVALVPIEAEEETTVVTRPAGIIDADKYPYADAHFDSDGNVWFGDGWQNVRDVTEEFNEWARNNKRTRYVTPWEAS